jgi:arginine/lysine/ornithine decarboxylase
MACLVFFSLFCPIGPVSHRKKTGIAKSMTTAERSEDTTMPQKHYALDQHRAPIYEALERFRQMRVVPFDVPGHKRGRGNPELAAFLGQQCVGLDVNSMKPLDNLCHPVSVIREAEELAADAFGAAHAFLMVGGTTSAVQSMVLTVCKRGDEIILPRNVHRSVINALVLCGAIPVYVNPDTHPQLGISLGMQRDAVAKAIREHPKAVAVLVNNPTYYGVCSDLRAIVKMAHEAGMLCLADEAHGTHFYFGDNFPISAMAAGADMASVSMHKSGGSLTQSSFLLAGPSIHAGYVRQIINLTQTTSGSYLLMSSLDISRRNLALRGKQVFAQVQQLAEYARSEINAIGDYYAFGRELINGDSVFDFDPTKLSVHTLDIGLAGIEVYDTLRDDYDIQIEFGDLGNILAYLSIGDRTQEVERLVSALAEIRRRYHRDPTGMLSQEYIEPTVDASPQDAFYAEKVSLPIEETEGRVCSEFVMCYPPGIPILAPGERITPEILQYIAYAREKGCQLTGPEDPTIMRLNVLK